MSNVIRTALKGGGKIVISINQWANGDFHLCVIEDWERMTGIERADIPAEAMNAAEDPDGLLREAVSQLVRKVHMNWEVSGKSGAPESRRETENTDCSGKPGMERINEP